MDPRGIQEISYNEKDMFVKPIRKGPIAGDVMEHKFNQLTPQKYQYYDGAANVIGTPYQQSGRRNKNFTSLSFVSNSVFYEPAKNLGLSKQDMYTTTNKLHQSKSVERLPGTGDLRCHNLQGNRSPDMPVRHNNHHRTNMTTIDTEFGKNLNNIYKEKLGIRPISKISASD